MMPLLIYMEQRQLLQEDDILPVCRLPFRQDGSTGDHVGASLLD